MRKLSFLLILFSITNLLGQDIGISPYSSTGIGDIKFDNNAERFGMGSLSAAMLNPFGANANFSNPAANINLRNTNFNMSATRDVADQTSNFGTNVRATTYISNLSLAFPMGSKMRAGIGFQPFSAVGYDFRSTNVQDGITSETEFKGDGGLNSLHGFFSYNLKPNFSLGITMKYLFGDLTTDQQVQTSDSDLIADFNFESDTKGFQPTIGAFYQKKIGENKTLDLGLTFTPQFNVNTDTRALRQTFFIANSQQANIDTVSFEQTSTSINMPSSVSFGATYSKVLKWAIGAQVDYTNWASFDRPLNPFVNNVEYRNSYRFAAGGWWIPNFNGYKTYFSRMHYRAGMFYQSEPFILNGSNINRYGINFGLGLPIGKRSNDPSTINLGLELGRRGTKNLGLVEENYFSLKVGFSLNDTWFVRRLYD